MKILSSILASYVTVFAGAQTPRPVPASYSSNAPINYVRTWEAVKPITSANDLHTGNAPQIARMATQYLDGLGRPIQTVVKKGALITDTSDPQSSLNAVDMISAVEYDAFGREQFKYLPFAATTATGSSTPLNDGLFKINPFQQQAAFYNNSNTNNPIKGQGETFFYGQTQFEASPLNRVEKQLAAGNSWMGAGRGVSIKYWINTTSDAVRIWSVAEGTNMGDFGSYTTSATYPAGELYKTVTEDENSKQVIEFKDKEGKVVLKKVQLLDQVNGTQVADNGTGSATGYNGWLCTYYIYDDLGELRCVIQPEGVKTLAANSWDLNYSSAVLHSEQCFRYEYDQRGRMIVKKVPGAAPVQMVYDTRDRLVLTQDGNLNTAHKWLYTQYDELNRPIATGLITDNANYNNAAYHRSQAYSSTAYPNLSNYTSEELTRTFYDDYSWLTSNSGQSFSSSMDGSFNNYYSAASVTQYPYAETPTQSFATRGMVTGSKVKVLGTSTYLYTISYYDEKGRVIQVQSQNITDPSAIDIVTTQYSFAGHPLVTVQRQQKGSGSSAQKYTIATRNNYDDLGRVVSIEKSLKSEVGTSTYTMPAWKTTAQMQYDALGQLKTKKIGTDPNNASAPLETLTYDYNIRGWTLGANRDYAKNTSSSTNYFGFDLGYDKTDIAVGASSIGSFNQGQYNGNITGTVWKSKGDGEIRKYDFSYDNVNRLTGADFKQYSSSVFDKSAGVDFSLSNMSYDANGNIKSMNQMGLKIGGSSLIDQLTYNYLPNSNKLQNVVDASQDKTTRLGDFRYSTLYESTVTINKANTAIDYTYDVNGNLTRDRNKDIENSSGAEGIEYNHLNLPSKITVKRSASANKGTIEYRYDAAGNKLQKITTEDAFGSNPQKVTTTTYLGGLVFEKVDVGTTMGSDELQLIAHEEGRARNTKDASGNINGFVFDYFLRDHLGNVRMVLTEEQKQDKYPVASLESVKLSTEQQYYNINTAQIVDGTTVTGLPAYTNDNGIGNNPHDQSFEGANSQKLYVLNSNTQKTGLGITLKVMAGDRLDIFGKSYYFQNNTGGAGANNPIPALEILSGMLGTPSGIVASSAHEAVSAAQLNNNTPTTSGIATLLSSETTDNNQNTLKPKAYINYIFFDEQFRYAGSSNFSPVGNNSSLTDHHQDTRMQNITVPKNGYVYIYCSNESPVNVYFDNLQVVHTRGAMLEETHYYPFGLVMSGISSKAASSSENRRKFNDGSELENKEFSDGSGLELYSTAYRGYDPQIGRFHQIDPWAGLSNEYSTYAYCMNNPILFNDPLGLDTVRVNGEGSHKIQVRSGDVLAWTIDDVTSYYTYDPKNPDAVNGFVGGGIENHTPLPGVTVSARAKPKDNSDIAGASLGQFYLSMSASAAENLGGFDNAMKLLQEGKFQMAYNGQLKTWSLNFYGNKAVSAELVQANKVAFAAKATGNMAYFKAVKAGGVVLNVAGILITTWDMKRNGVNAKNATDMGMGFVAFIPGGGWIISGGYFAIDAFYPGGVKGFSKDEGQRNASLNQTCGCDNQAFWH